jgi:signal transduction histidine kinase
LERGGLSKAIRHQQTPRCRTAMLEIPQEFLTHIDCFLKATRIRNRFDLVGAMLKNEEPPGVVSVSHNPSSSV